MANRLRGNFLEGIVTSITAGNPATLTLASPLNIAIPSGYYLPIVLNPPPYVSVSGTNVLSEIVWTTGTYNSETSSFTVIRAQEETSSLGSQINIPYAVGPTAQDFGINNWIANGDFPSTPSGTFLVSTGPSVSGVIGYLIPSGLSNNQLVGISGGVIVGISTISGAQIYGNLSNATISGSQLVGTPTISGALFWDSEFFQGIVLGSTVAGVVLSGVNTMASGAILNGQNQGTILNTTISGSQIIESVILSSANIVAPNNSLIEATASQVVTSPPNIKGNNFGVFVNYNASPTNAVYILASSGNLIGPGIPPGATETLLRIQNANITFVSDGMNWIQTTGAQDSGWVTPGFQNSWGAYGTPAYRYTGNTVKLRSAIVSGISNTVAFQLPGAAVPLQTEYFVNVITTTSGISTGIVAVYANGNVIPTWSFPGTLTLCDLSPISFTTD